MSTERHDLQPGHAERWRIFVAIPVSAQVRKTMQQVQNALARHHLPVRWVDPKLAHITLRFFGDTPVESLKPIHTELAEIAAAFRPFHLQTGGLGAFPSLGRPRVLWLHLDGEVQRLAALARRVEDFGESGPPDQKKRPFRAHVTLGRMRDGAALPDDFRSIAESLTLPQHEMRIECLHLVRSVLGPKGPTYTTLAEYRLGTPVGVAEIALPELREHG